jgi:hypothetical protein
MKAPELYRLLNLFGQLTDARALSVNYRVLALAPTSIRACAPYGCMQAEAALGGLDREVYIKADDFLQILQSLPDQEFQIVSTTDNALRWQCGDRAKGHMTLLSGQAEGGINVPAPEYSDPVPDKQVRREFGEGLELGALACGSMAMRTVGLEGIQIRNNGDKAYAYSCDVFSLARCCLGDAIQAPETITLKPDAASLLAAVVKRDGQAMLASNARAVYCMTPKVELLLNQTAPMQHDLPAALAKFDNANIKVPLFREIVTAFLKRVDALAADRQKATVDIAVIGGQTILSFTEIGGSAQDSYTVTGDTSESRALVPYDVPPVKLEAHRVAKALEHATDLVFDYAQQRSLILRGPKDFVFGIVGRAD